MSTSDDAGQICGKAGRHIFEDMDAGGLHETVQVYCAANFGQVLACLIVARVSFVTDLRPGKHRVLTAQVPISEHRIFGVMGWRICLAVVGILRVLVASFAPTQKLKQAEFVQPMSCASVASGSVLSEHSGNCRQLKAGLLVVLLVEAAVEDLPRPSLAESTG